MIKERLEALEKTKESISTEIINIERTLEIKRRQLDRLDGAIDTCIYFKNLKAEEDKETESKTNKKSKKETKK